MAGYWSDEFGLEDVSEVREVLRSAEEQAEGRTFVVCAALALNGELGLVRLAGDEPLDTPSP
jgi:hypothetical protein